MADVTDSKIDEGSYIVQLGMVTMNSDSNIHSVDHWCQFLALDPNAIC